MGENFGYPQDKDNILSEREYARLKKSEERYARELKWSNQTIQELDNLLIEACSHLPTNKVEELRKALEKLRKRYD